MKAEDLMIGDRVKFNNSDLVHQIKAIAGKSVKVDKVYWYSASKLSPIPITSEILEKNGFVVESGFCHGNPLQYCVLVDGLWIYISGENYFEGNLEYVHQLQHALKLCGIEKEIVL